ncbi:hypothetical protein DFP72DRAFT_879082 [Ephemerocybe angulata]|uniref:F-box domain-containing protein n=1 Tax=Ephemerocybe angulata TaxID=980116 RepID=A0A8H6IBT3_9AGAR|nr:hypothetical protein DFP72DRAFT_879082 [Tulosesus angulatus]
MVRRRPATAALPVTLSSRIPREIVDIIIASAKHKTTLKRFSLVCHAWAATSQRRLFSSTALTPRLIRHLDGDPHASQRLWPLIQHSSIRRLYEGTHVLLLKQKKDTLRVLPGMTRLNSLALLECSPQLVRLLGEIFKADNRISTLRLGQVHKFPSFTDFQECIAMFSGLQSIALYQVTWGDDNQSTLVRGEVYKTIDVPSKLKEVEIYECPGIAHMLSWLVGTRRATTRTLRVPWLRPVEIALLRQFTHLENLEINLVNHSIPGPVRGSLDGILSGWGRLKTLKIGYIQCMLDWTDRLVRGSGMAWYTEVLLSLKTPLPHLHFVLAYENVGELDNFSWRDLNTTLHSWAFSANLETLEVTFYGTGKPRLSERVCEEMVRTRLDGLHANTRLNVRSTGH